MMSGGKNEENTFVDREEILEKLKTHLERVRNSDGHLVLLKGEAGVGKSAIAEEFADRCGNENLKVLTGRCLYYESTDPYIPFLEALKEYLDTHESETTYDGGRQYSSIGARSIKSTSTFGGPVGLIGVKSYTEEEADISLTDKREIMFDKVTNLIIKLSKRQPVLLFLDDMQWIDEASAQLLHHVTRHISNNQVMILGAYRPEELISKGEEMPLDKVLDRMREEKLLSEIEVPRMKFQATSKMIKDILKRDDLPNSFLLMVFRETEGNPYYVIEILNSMVDEGIIDPYSYDWDPERDLSNVIIPSSIRDITSRRLSKLSSNEKKVLMYASTIGTEFNFEVLEEAMHMDVIELLDIIDDLISRGLIQEKDGAEQEIYRFNHVQLKISIYDDMGRSRKRVLHKHVGDAIENIHKSNLEKHYYTLSSHFYKGKDYPKAYEYSLGAGEKALQSFAIETAIEHYEIALKSINKARKIDEKEKKKLELYNKLGELYHDITDYDKAEEMFRKKLELARKVEDKESEAFALLQVGHILKDTQRYNEAENDYDKALDIFKELDEPEGIADANRGLGYIHWRNGEFKDSIEHYEEGIKEAKEAEDQKTLALIYLEMGLVYGHRGDNDTAIDYFKQSVEQLENKGAYRDISRAYNNIGDQYMKKEEWETAIEYFDKSVEYANKIGNKTFIGWCYFNRAEAMAKSGDPDSAEMYVDRAEEVLENLNDKVGLCSVYRVRGIIKGLQENYDAALGLLFKSLNKLEELGIPFLVGEDKYEIGVVYETMGDKENARKYYEEAQEIFEGLGAELFLKKLKERLDDL
ncbi:MAG: tetratricopeptide repeat protein [Thermoplasmata archaeon]